MIIKNLYNKLSIPEKSGKKIGLFRILVSIVGGFLLTYLGMTFLVLILPIKIDYAVFIPFLIATFIWACSTLWISLSYTKLEALLKVLIPSCLFIVGIIFFVVKG